jgi:hypothetical protein
MFSHLEEIWTAADSNMQHRKCKTLTAYASLTTVGDESWYEAEQGETVHGAKLVQRNSYVQ